MQNDKKCWHGKCVTLGEYCNSTYLKDHPLILPSKPKSFGYYSSINPNNIDNYTLTIFICQRLSWLADHNIDKSHQWHWQQIGRPCHWWAFCSSLTRFGKLTCSDYSTNRIWLIFFLVWHENIGIMFNFSCSTSKQKATGSKALTWNKGPLFKSVLLEEK